MSWSFSGLRALLSLNRRAVQTSTKWLSSGRELVSLFDPSIPVERATTPPSLWYTDKDFYNLEMDLIFKRNWVGVAGADRLSKKGDYLTGRLGNEPYLLTKSTADCSVPATGISAFYNVCRHHATLLMDCESGTCDKLQCPYHGWIYNLDGRLARATRLKGIENFSAKNNSLLPIQCNVWESKVVFLKLAPSTDDDGQHPHGEHLEGLKQVFSEKAGLDLASMTHVARREFTINCNWKVAIDNFLDGGYHVEYAHKDLNAQLDPTSYQTEVYHGGAYSTQSVKATGLTNRLGTSPAIFAHIYPNVMVNRYGSWADVNYVIPRGAGQCDVVFDWYVDAKFKEQFQGDWNDYVETSLEASVKVQLEDNILCERVQQGLNSSAAASGGRYAPGVEFADHAFHVKLANDLKEGLYESNAD